MCCLCCERRCVSICRSVPRSALDCLQHAVIILVDGNNRRYAEEFRPDVHSADGSRRRFNVNLLFVDRIFRHGDRNKPVAVRKVEHFKPVSAEFNTLSESECGSKFPCNLYIRSCSRYAFQTCVTVLVGSTAECKTCERCRIKCRYRLCNSYRSFRHSSSKVYRLCFRSTVVNFYGQIGRVSCKCSRQISRSGKSEHVCNTGICTVRVIPHKTERFSRKAASAIIHHLLYLS